jgi:UDPglucose 6-dehydrogenase
MVVCDLRSAEVVKYASNAFLATKISFINEMAQLCEKSGADVQQVAYGMGLDNRIGPKMLHAGIGYGGSCFPKDVAALRRTSLDFAYDFSLVAGVMEVNDAQWRHFADKVFREFGENLNGKTIACLGLAFKANTDDIRDSVAIKIIQTLRGRGAKIRAYDPVATKNAKAELGTSNMYYAKNEYDAMKDADALCILTEWDEFVALDLKKIKKLLKKNVIFDGRILLNKDDVEKAGFTYYTVGKRTNAYKDEKVYLPTAILNGR